MQRTSYSQPISSESDFASLSENLSKIQNFGLHINPSDCFESTSAPSQSLFPTEHSVIDIFPFPRAESVKYLDAMVRTNLQWSSHITDCVKRICSLSFQICKLRGFGSNQTDITTFVHQCVISTLLYCSPVIFSGLIKKGIHSHYRNPSLISCFFFFYSCWLLCW